MSNIRISWMFKKKNGSYYILVILLPTKSSSLYLSVLYYFYYTVYERFFITEYTPQLIQCLSVNAMWRFFLYKEL